MKNSTLVRIKVPKALYESALKKALMEAKEPIRGHKGKKYSKEDDYDKPAKKVNPKAGHKKTELVAKKKNSKVHGDTYTEKAPVKKSEMKMTSNSPLAESKKKKIKESDEFGSSFPQPNSSNTGGSRSATLYPNRKPEKDTNRLAEKKKIKESLAAGDWGIAAGALATFLGLSTMIVKNMFKYMKDNNLKGMKGFMQAYNAVGKGVTGQVDQSKGYQNEGKKKKVEEKKKYNLKELAAHDALESGEYIEVKKGTKVPVGNSVIRKDGNLFLNVLKIMGDPFNPETTYLLQYDMDGEKEKVKRKDLEKYYIVEK